MVNPINPEQKEEAERLVTEAYALVGHVATGFSALEFHLQFLLNFFITGKELAPEGFVIIRKQQFAERLDLLRDLVRLRLPSGTELRIKTDALIDELNGLREKRNLHVHGFWLINWYLVVNKMVRVSDPKWRLDKSTDSWNSMATTDVTLDSLREQTTQIAQLIERLHALIEEIKVELFQKKMPNPDHGSDPPLHNDLGMKANG